MTLLPRIYICRSDTKPGGAAVLKQEKFVGRVTWTVILVANAVLFALILASPPYSIYDEGPYIAATKLLDDYGLSVDFLRGIPGAAGPLHAVVYDAFIRLFGLTFPYPRLLSFALLLVSAWLLSRVARATVRAADLPDHVGAGLIGGIMTVLPTAAVSAGMALTEMPAVFFVSLALLLLVWTMSASSLSASIAFAAAVGLALGTAVLGRQNYLMVLPCLLTLPTWTGDAWPRDVMRIGVLCAVAIAVVVPVFLIWGGLVPPKTAFVGEGVALWNGVLAMGYAGIVGFLIAPEIITTRVWHVLAAAVIALVIWALIGVSTMPMYTAVGAILGEGGDAAFGALFGSVISFVATYFTGCMGYHLWRNRDNRITLFHGVTALAGFASGVKVTHQFSSRYVFVFLPVLLLSLAPAMRSTWHLPIRVAVGAGVGLISVYAYLSASGP